MRRRSLLQGGADEPIIDFVSQDFSYTGAVESLTLPKGTYRIQCWGAQGGTVSYGNYSGAGGKGGYSVGELTLNKNTIIYVYVGGQGVAADRNATAYGGFNGGGNSYSPSTTGVYEGSGGGASDVRIGQDSLYARVIVAGGGGGGGANAANKYTYGGHGGGQTGGDGRTITSSQIAATGGSQTSPGVSRNTKEAEPTTCSRASFGLGAGTRTKTGGSGGGGGWYGGGCATYTSSGGGSGYVYNSSTAVNYPSGCLLDSKYYLANSSTFAGNVSFPSTTSGNETGHTGSGYVRIVKI